MDKNIYDKKKDATRRCILQSYIQSLAHVDYKGCYVWLDYFLKQTFRKMKYKSLTQIWNCLGQVFNKFEKLHKLENIGKAKWIF